MYFVHTCTWGVPLEQLTAAVHRARQCAKVCRTGAPCGPRWPRQLTRTLSPHLRAATSRRANLAPRENRSGTAPWAARVASACCQQCARRTGDGMASHTVSHSRRRRACPQPRRAALAQQPCRVRSARPRPQPREKCLYAPTADGCSLVVQPRARAKVLSGPSAAEPARAPHRVACCLDVWRPAAGCGNEPTACVCQKIAGG